MQRKPERDTEFQRALEASSQCPRCGTTYDGGSGPNAGTVFELKP